MKTKLLVAIVSLLVLVVVYLSIDRDDKVKQQEHTQSFKNKYAR